mmetsp:Transcript_7601/g.20609  ORF Transcript_7601/g.20609 Transcript_7601/m.20609 type:complete len:227 (+) Transcript_7601:529-1209(+)
MSLTCVCQDVGVLLVQEVLLGEVPELEHVVQNLSPESHRLEHEGVLPRVRVREARAIDALLDRQGVLWGARVDRVEVLPQKADQAVAGLPIEPKVCAVVTERVEALLYHVLGELVRILVLRLVLGVRVGIARAQEAERVAVEVVLPSPGHRAVAAGEVLDGGFLRLDLALDLHPALALGHNLHRGDAQLRVLEHLEAPRTPAQHVVDGPHADDAVKLDELAHIGLA